MPYCLRTYTFFFFFSGAGVYVFCFTTIFVSLNNHVDYAYNYMYTVKLSILPTDFPLCIGFNGIQIYQTIFTKCIHRRRSWLVFIVFILLSDQPHTSYSLAIGEVFFLLRSIGIRWCDNKIVIRNILIC